MNQVIGYEMLWLFLAYSFLGWILETVLATIKQRKFANRGLVDGPLCIIYGVGAVLMTIGLHELTGFWLFAFAVIYATVVEWVGGHLIERFYHERWWNYSNVKWNLDGYICLPASLCWGVLGYVTVRWGNGWLLDLFGLLPLLLVKITVLILMGILAVDVLASYILLVGKSKRLGQWAEVDEKITGFSARLGDWIANHIEKRIHKAYPRVSKVEPVPRDKQKFAQGCDFYKVVMLFFIGAFLGDLVETVFCRITAGVWMSRSSVVWGPFSIVWGLAIALATAMLYKYRDRKESFLFGIGTFLGGAYEYFCSVFTEIVFGKVFWDYSRIPFNLGGRINLLYCFFWGIAAVVWFKKLYPLISGLLEKLPVMVGKIFTWLLIVFMSCNVIVSCMALIRYEERTTVPTADTAWKEWIDVHYDDSKMEQIYPNAKPVSR